MKACIALSLLLLAHAVSAGWVNTVNPINRIEINGAFSGSPWPFNPAKANLIIVPGKDTAYDKQYAPAGTKITEPSSTNKRLTITMPGKGAVRNKDDTSHVKVAVTKYFNRLEMNGENRVSLGFFGNAYWDPSAKVFKCSDHFKIRAGKTIKLITNGESFVELECFDAPSGTLETRIAGVSVDLLGRTDSMKLNKFLVTKVQGVNYINVVKGVNVVQIKGGDAKNVNPLQGELKINLRHTSTKIDVSGLQTFQGKLLIRTQNLARCPDAATMKKIVQGEYECSKTAKVCTAAEKAAGKCNW